MYSTYVGLIEKTFAVTDFKNFDLAVKRIVNALECKKRIFLFGNGGSAATASHFVVDWRKSVSEKLNFYPNVYSLTDNLPIITAIANDISYEAIFSEQIKNSAQLGDLAIAISGSGNSKNVLNGILAANQIGLETIALTGFDGGQVAKIVQINCLVNSNNIKIVEDMHSAFGHAVVQAVVEK